MKRILINLSLVIILSFFIVPGTSAQEKEVEKRIKIVTVDEDGKKVVIDTILTGDMDLEDLDLLPDNIKVHSKENHRIYITSDDSEDHEDLIHVKEGNVVIMKKGEGDVFSIYSTDLSDEGGHKIMTWTIVDGDTIKKEAKAYTGKSGSFAWVSSGDEKIKTIDLSTNDLEDDEKEIIIYSSDGHEKIKIKGDAVISIVDGRVKIESGEATREVEREVIKKKKKQ